MVSRECPKRSAGCSEPRRRGVSKRPALVRVVGPVAAAPSTHMLEAGTLPAVGGRPSVIRQASSGGLPPPQPPACSFLSPGLHFPAHRPQLHPGLAWEGTAAAILQVPRPQQLSLPVRSGSQALAVFHPTTLNLESRGKPQVLLEGGHCLRPCGLLGLGAGATLKCTAPGRGPATIMATVAPEDSRAHREDMPMWGRSGDQKTQVQDWLRAVLTVLPS